MLNRRHLLTAAATLPLATGHGAWAQAMPRELVFAVVPAENAAGTSERYRPLADYLTAQTGVRTIVRVASDYAAVIEGQRAGTIHIGYYGPGAYVRAHQQSGGNVVAFTTNKSRTGAMGYYAVGYVRADSPFRTIEDLRGRKLGLVDPNSTSGNFAPRYFLHKQGIEPESFFSAVTYTGSQENAVIALLNGTVDMAMNWWNAPGDSNFDRMVDKRMVPAGAVRIAWKSELLPGSPIAYLNSLPEALKRSIAEAFYRMHEKDLALLQRIENEQTAAWVPVQHSDFADMVEMLAFIDRQRRSRRS
jgi:phosphonate transport system substrate-binding protein